MDILKFALGVRFDFMKESYSDEDASFILGEITKVLSAEETAGLHVFGGKAKLDDRDGDGIFTVVFMNGKMKFMRNVYRKLNSDAVVNSWLDHRIPFIQNNQVRAFDGLEYYGEIKQDGSFTGGSGRMPAFHEQVEARPLVSPDRALLVAVGGSDNRSTAETLALSIKTEIPGINAETLSLPDSVGDLPTALEFSVNTLRHGMKVTAPSGEKAYFEYLLVDHSRCLIPPFTVPAEQDTSEELTSFGLGELIVRAAHEGASEIFICSDGPAVNDCGLGMARAIGCEVSTDPDNSIDTSKADGSVMAAKLYAVSDSPNSLSNGLTRLLTEAFGAEIIAPSDAFLELIGLGSIFGKASHALFAAEKDHLDVCKKTASLAKEAGVKVSVVEAASLPALKEASLRLLSE